MKETIKNISKVISGILGVFFFLFAIDSSIPLTHPIVSAIIGLTLVILAKF